MIICPPGAGPYWTTQTFATEKQTFACFFKHGLYFAFIQNSFTLVRHPSKLHPLIFMSAQPDDYYFLWQLELQLHNFHSLGIKPENIHVLIGYDPKKGLSADYRMLIQKNKSASFYAYPDSRVYKDYLPSIRPHIIAKHFQALPSMQETTIFYHDSDIIFRDIPDLVSLETDNTWYASDTRHYLDCNYIVNTAGRQVLDRMCEITGISPLTAALHDDNAGGAQYLIKQCETGFWQKIERDSENLYQFLENHNLQEGWCAKKDNPGRMQSWCADMWAFWWNALLYGKNFRIHPELNFCWADSPIEEFNKTRILHYTGLISRENKHIFRKQNYINYPPYYDDLTILDEATCSKPMKDLIEEFNNDQLLRRINLADTSFLLPVRIDSEDRLENIYAITRYIHKNFDTTIILLEEDSEPKIDKSLLPAGVQYLFIKNDHKKLHYTKTLNYLIGKSKTPYLALYDIDVIIPEKQIIEAVRLLREGDYSMISPYSGRFLNVDLLLKAIFIKLQDTQVLESNQGKLFTCSLRSYGGVVFVDRLAYIKAGMENEHLTSWGPNDVERIKRMEILGYKVKRLHGNLYHLHHARGENSGYQSTGERIDFMNEYFKVCSMRRKDLSDYISTWKWVNLQSPQTISC
jgi:hypothetical protein